MASKHFPGDDGRDLEALVSQGFEVRIDRVPGKYRVSVYFGRRAGFRSKAFVTAVESLAGALEEARNGAARWRLAQDVGGVR